MVGVRSRITQICMAGHAALLLLCSQHFLLKAAQAEPNSEEQNDALRAFYMHIQTMIPLVYHKQMRSCFPNSPFPLQAGPMVEYGEKWVGKVTQGRENLAIMAAYFNGNLDAFQMMWNYETKKNRKDIFVPFRPCSPFKNRACWKRYAWYTYESCDLCCSPYAKGGYGEAWCWQGPWDFENCCQQDFAGLVCKEDRKGEEGGCVDCPKSVRWQCVTPKEHALDEAIKEFNKQVDERGKLETRKHELVQEVSLAEFDYAAKMDIYDFRWQLWETAEQIFVDMMQRAEKRAVDAAVLAADTAHNFSHARWENALTEMNTADKLHTEAVLALAEAERARNAALFLVKACDTERKAQQHSVAMLELSTEAAAKERDANEQKFASIRHQLDAHRVFVESNETEAQAANATYAFIEDELSSAVEEASFASHNREAILQEAEKIFGEAQERLSNLTARATAKRIALNDSLAAANTTKLLLVEDAKREGSMGAAAQKLYDLVAAAAEKVSSAWRMLQHSMLAFLTLSPDTPAAAVLLATAVPPLSLSVPHSIVPQNASGCSSVSAEMCSGSESVFASCLSQCLAATPCNFDGAFGDSHASQADAERVAEQAEIDAQAVLLRCNDLNASAQRLAFQLSNITSARNEVRRSVHNLETDLTRSKQEVQSRLAAAGEANQTLRRLAEAVLNLDQAVVTAQATVDADSKSLDASRANRDAAIQAEERASSAAAAEADKLRVSSLALKQAEAELEAHSLELQRLQGLLQHQEAKMVSLASEINVTNSSVPQLVSRHVESWAVRSDSALSPLYDALVSFAASLDSLLTSLLEQFGLLGEDAERALLLGKLLQSRQELSTQTRELQEMLRGVTELESKAGKKLRRLQRDHDKIVKSVNVKEQRKAKAASILDRVSKQHEDLAFKLNSSIALLHRVEHSEPELVAQRESIYSALNTSGQYLTTVFQRQQFLSDMIHNATKSDDALREQETAAHRSLSTERARHMECMSEYELAADRNRQALERVRLSTAVEELARRCGSLKVAAAFSAAHPCWEGLRERWRNSSAVLSQAEFNFTAARNRHRLAVQLVEDRKANLSVVQLLSQKLVQELKELEHDVEHANDTAAVAEMRLAFTRDPAAAARQKTDEVMHGLTTARHAVEAAAGALAETKKIEGDLTLQLSQCNSSLILSAAAESEAFSSLRSAQTRLRRITEECDERREDLAAVVVTVEIEDKNATRLRRKEILRNKTFWENATRMERDGLKAVLEEKLSAQSEVDSSLNAANITARKVFTEQQVSQSEEVFNSSLVALDAKYLERQTTNQKLETCYESLGTLWNAYEKAKSDLEAEQEYMRTNNIESRSFNLVLGDDKWHQEQEQKQQGG